MTAKKRNRVLAVLALAVFGLVGAAGASSAVGVAVGTKVKGTAELRPSDDKTFKAMSPGAVLYDRDFVRTGVNGFLVLVYLDDKSMLKVKANTNLEIQGKREGRAIFKRIDMTAGTLKAEISEQRKGEFVVFTPTSTASVKGTSFWLISDPLLGDQLFGLGGLVELLNLISGNVVTVGPGQTGTSNPDGSLNVATTVSQNIPLDEEEAGEEIKEVRIQFRNAQGEERFFIIRYD